jgi:hypothetical protein
MELVVDLSTGGVALRRREELQRFSVQVVAADPGGRPLDALAAALGAHAAGTIGPDGDALVPVDALRRLAGDAADGDGGSIDSDWESAFAGMVDYAVSKGWTAEDGCLRAHVEWGS